MRPNRSIEDDMDKKFLYSMHGDTRYQKQRNQQTENYPEFKSLEDIGYKPIQTSRTNKRADLEHLRQPPSMGSSVRGDDYRARNGTEFGGYFGHPYDKMEYYEPGIQQDDPFRLKLQQFDHSFSPDQRFNRPKHKDSIMVSESDRRTPYQSEQYETRLSQRDYDSNQSEIQSQIEARIQDLAEENRKIDRFNMAMAQLAKQNGKNLYFDGQAKQQDFGQPESKNRLRNDKNMRSEYESMRSNETDKILQKKYESSKRVEEILDDLRGLYSLIENMERQGENVEILKANVQMMLSKIKSTGYEGDSQSQKSNQSQKNSGTSKKRENMKDAPNANLQSSQQTEENSDVFQKESDAEKARQLAEQKKALFADMRKVMKKKDEPEPAKDQNLDEQKKALFADMKKVMKKNREPSFEKGEPMASEDDQKR